MPDPAASAVVLDTDVASRSFRGRLSPAVAARLAGRQPVLTFVTIGELTQWTRLRHWGPHSIASLDAWLADKPVLPAARSVAMRWGELSDAATQRGRPRPVNDSWGRRVLPVGGVIELEPGITVYPVREERGRWRAVWQTG